MQTVDRADRIARLRLVGWLLHDLRVVCQSSGRNGV